MGSFKMCVVGVAPAVGASGRHPEQAVFSWTPAIEIRKSSGPSMPRRRMNRQWTCRKCRSTWLSSRLRSGSCSSLLARYLAAGVVPHPRSQPDRTQQFECRG